MEFGLVGAGGVITHAFTFDVVDMLSIADRSIVFTGKVGRGEVHVGATLRLTSPAGETVVKVKSLEPAGFRRAGAQAGDNVAIVVEPVDLDDVADGFYQGPGKQFAVTSLTLRGCNDPVGPTPHSAILYLVEPGPRPPYYLIADLVWGEGANIDSDGDSTTPADTQWTELSMQLRDRMPEAVIHVDPISHQPLILQIHSSDGSLTQQVASFLCQQSGGYITNEPPLSAP